MKKRIVSLVVALLGLMFINAAPALAFSPLGDVCSQAGASSSVACSSDQSTTTPAQEIDNVVNIISLVAGIVAVIIIIISGLMFVTGGGDPQRVSEAKNTIIFAVIGLVVIALARTIIVFIINKVST